MPEAVKAVSELANFVPLPDVADHEKFLAALIGLFSQYPAAVTAEAINPVKGIPARLKVLRIASVKEILDEFNEPYARAAARDRAAEEARRSLPPPTRKRTPEEQARIDAQVAEVRQKFGIPAEGLPRR